MHPLYYTIKTNEDGTRTKVYVKDEPVSAERVIYFSRKGGKSLNIGMNRAKRVARIADERDQLNVLKTLGPGYPRQHDHHQQLVLTRHTYYHEQHEEFLRARG